MYIMLTATLINLILDPIMIFEKIPFIDLIGIHLNGAGLGVFGAALATVISQTLTFFMGIYFVFYRTRSISPEIKNLFKLNKEIDKKLILIGLPNGFEVLLRNVFHAIVLKFVSLFGSVAIAAFGIAGRIFGLAFMPLIGLSLGGASIVGQSLGANNVRRAHQTAIVSGIVSSSLMMIFSLIVFFYGDKIMWIFTKDTSIIRYGFDFLKFGTIGLVFLGFGLGLAVSFSGSGFNKPFIYSSLISRWLIQLPILIIAILYLKSGIIWIWLSFLSGDIVEFIVFLKYFIDKKWIYKRV